MIEESEGLERILSEIPVGPTRKQGLVSALGGFARRDIFASVPLPGFENSAMDGYAVRAQDCSQKGAELKVIGEQPAGEDRGLKLEAGEAIRIFTGAPIPSGADAVVMQEDTESCSLDGGKGVKINDPPEVGEFIRRKGCDTCIGQKILASGDPISPQMVGLLASQGIAEVEVGVPPKVGILTTGDELISPGEPLKDGQLYNSNGAMLESLAFSAGAESVILGHVTDDAEILRQLLKNLLEECQFLLISGGVSVGDHDHVKSTLKEVGVTSEFWRVRVKPGKPFLFGQSVENDAFVFGLPGNPVSSFVTFLAFVRPAMRKWLGAGDQWLGMEKRLATAGEELRNRGDRPHYLRGALDAQGRFMPSGLQQSHALGALARANAIVRLEAEEVIPQGQVVTALSW